MSQLKINTTSKLFYKRWLYKVVITCNGINHLHRRGMDYVKEVTPMGSGFWGARHWSQNVFDNKKELLEIGAYLESVLQGKEYQVRAEGDKAAIFTNDTVLIDLISKGLEPYVTAVYKPSDPIQAKFLSENKTKIICKELPHENYRFKIHFKNGDSPNKDFMERFLTWAKKYDGKIHIPQGTERILNGSTHPYFYGHYYYAKDQKMASMALMFMGEHLNKAEEFVLDREIA